MRRFDAADYFFCRIKRVEKTGGLTFIGPRYNMCAMKPRTLLVFSRSKRIKLNVSGYYAMAPLGVSQLASVLIDEGYPVQILDVYAERWSDSKVATRFRVFFQNQRHFRFPKKVGCPKFQRN